MKRKTLIKIKKVELLIMTFALFGLAAFKLFLEEPGKSLLLLFGGCITLGLYFYFDLYDLSN